MNDQNLIGAAGSPMPWLAYRSLWVSFFGWGYMKGSHSAEMAAERLTRALALRAEELKQAHSRQIAALRAKNRRGARCTAD